jgi:hypothetical protein
MSKPLKNNPKKRHILPLLGTDVVSSPVFSISVRAFPNVTE